MKDAKKSLLASGVSILLSVALLLGITFAWFTDSVTNTANRVEAGTLDIELNDGTTTPLFSSENNFLWEPGRSKQATVMVKNVGSLWLKYTMSFENVVTSGDADITQVLDVYKVSKETAEATDLTAENYLGTVAELMAKGSFAAKDAVLAPQGQTGVVNDETVDEQDTFTLVIKMQESAGNKYQNAGITFDVVINAAQYTYEKDGFGSNQYDADAKYDFIPEGVTETDNNMGVSLAFEWALRSELKEAGIMISDSEPLSYKDLRKFTGKLDLSGYKIGSTITANNAAMPTYYDNGQYASGVLTQEDKELFEGFTVPWSISDLAYGLMGVTELDLSDTGIEYIPSMFLIGNPTIEKITLPDTVISIGYMGTEETGLNYGYNSFAWMKNLKTVNMPASLKYMADYSFTESPSLELNIETIPALTRSGRKLFSLQYRGSTYQWADESKVTGDIAVFAEKNKNADLADFIFEDTAVTGDAAAISNNPLTYKSTFGNIKGITGTLTIPENTVLSAWMFDSWSIDTLNIPYETTVNGQAFFNNTSLKNVNVTYTGVEPSEDEKQAFIDSLFNGGTTATITWTQK